MKAGYTVTAIDIGTTKICVIIAEFSEEGKLEVKGIAVSPSAGLVNGHVVDMLKASKSIKDSIMEAEEMAKCKARNIYVGIAGDHIKSQNTLGRISLTTGSEPCEITQEHVDNVITNSKNNVKIQQGNERLDIIHAIPQDYEIDGQGGILNPVNMSGFNLTAYVHIVMADINTLRNISRCVEIAGYKVIDTFLEPLASSHSVLNDVEKELGSVLIDIGGGTTDIAVFHKGSIRYSAVIPLGGTNITHDLSIGLQTSPRNAEKIKIDLGNSLATDIPEEKYVEIEGIGGREPKKKKLRYVANIIEARMREILEGAYAFLEENQELSIINAGLTITGGASQLVNADKLSEQIFSMSTKLGYPDLTKLSGPVDRLENPRFSTSVGILYHIIEKLSKEHYKIQSIKDTGSSIGDFFKRILTYFKDYI